MRMLKVGEYKYVNVEKVTFVVEIKGKIWIRFAIAGGQFTSGNTILELQGQEAQNFLRWMDANSENAMQ